MPLRNLLKRRDESPARAAAAAPGPPAAPPATSQQQQAQFTFIRTTTDTQEQIFPPQFAGDADRVSRDLFRRPGSPRDQRRHSQHQQHMQQQHMTREQMAGVAVGAGAGVGGVSGGGAEQQQQREPAPRTLTERLQAARRSRSRSVTSQRSSSSRPVTPATSSGSAKGWSGRDGQQQQQPPAAARGEDEQAVWELRATQLAHDAPGAGSRPVTPVGGAGRARAVSDAASDVGVSFSFEDGGTDCCRTGFRWLLSCTKRAVRRPCPWRTARLTCQDLVRSTEMFGRLADPNGANNALSQVLYGLALR
jgi:hypothetical protein